VNKSLIVISFLVLISGCVHMPNDFPKLDQSNEQVVFIVGEFLRGKHLNQFSRCESGEVICMDPPPLGLKVRVLEHINGDPLPYIIYVATTDHYGMSSYEFNGGDAYLIKLWTDGASFIMPRYDRHKVIKSLEGEFIIPIWTKDWVNMIPCQAKALVQELDPKSMSKQDSFLQEELSQKGREHMDQLTVHQGRVYTKYGIKVSQLKHLFDGMSYAALNERCLPDE